MYLAETLRFEAKVRTVVALIAAAIAPAAIFSCGLSIYFLRDNPAAAILLSGALFFYAIIVAGAHLIVLGLPAFWLGTRLGAIQWWSCVLIGALIGGLPYAAWGWPGTPRSLIADFKVGGAFGLIGGLTFWLLWRYWVRYDFQRARADSDSETSVGA